MALGRPANKNGGQMFYRSDYAGLSGPVLCTNVTNEQAIDIDTKLGDGRRGSYRSSNQARYPTSGNVYICTIL